MYSFTFDHGPGCQLRNRDDGTRAADFERPYVNGTLDRAATSTEIELFYAIAGYMPTEAEFRNPYDPPPTAPVPMTTVTAGPLYQRVVAGLDPDVLALELTA
ncbi:hypothetical protein [Arthrobacter oryzae]|uniref:Uncharacterized protein n=1 Tax=Arthrobacter oryzae TaxID=409290 RepID=A0A3N0BSD3_9MICC|nr:hypothetical protein [Arthrobacter oryzae]RNL51584.1 hypothetical protein D7003_15765 [Arthrobacter oryzae]